MCIFSGRVRSVSNTNIFGRLSGRGTQYLIYGMTYSSERPTAMILPLPVAFPQKRIGIRFINLKSYGGFFNDMEDGFREPAVFSEGYSGGAAPGGTARPTIRVESVGDFIASYVPALDDFDRVDRLFRLPRSVWNKIPKYADYGFAMFQLKDTSGKSLAPVPDPNRGIGGIVANADGIRVHPMALEFYTRFADTLYYPTVHIHDGQLHSSEHFDHSLYLQDPRLSADGGRIRVSDALSGTSSVLRMSRDLASNFVDCAKTQGAVEPRGICYKMDMHGTHPNRDALIRVG